MANILSSLVMFATLVVPSALKQANLSSPMTKTAVGSGDQELRVMNVQDYIYVQEEETDLPDLVDQFKEYARSKGYTNVSVNYRTTDTPESMFNEVKISPNSFDLICPSDYMIQKLIANDMIQPMEINEDHIPNYVKYASKKIKGQLDAIEVANPQDAANPYKLKDYAVGYMWGTLGLLFDASYNGRDEETMYEDLQDWSVLWNPDYKGIATVKDSVRDTYAIGLLHALNDDYQDENGQNVEGFETLMSKHESGEYDDETFNAKFTELFNKCDKATLSKVYKSLNKLKGNVFGMEVDSGKQDIVTGKIGINFAWSGDAVYSMEQAMDERKIQLCYSIPQTGSNLWMDAWCMPKSDTRSEAQTELAYLFLDFLSTPANAVQNMDSIGYTPFIAGDEILDLTREWYDYRTDEVTGEFDDIIPTAEEIDTNGLQRIDLSYFFDGTLDEYADDENACIFYSDCYLPAAETDEQGNINGGNRCVGEDFFCQFPDEYTLSRCAVMRDFGEQNEAVLKMWEKFKSNALPVWAVVLFVVEIAAALGLLGYFYLGNRVKRNLRKKRKEEQNKK